MELTVEKPFLPWVLQAHYVPDWRLKVEGDLAKTFRMCGLHRLHCGIGLAPLKCESAPVGTRKPSGNRLGVNVRLDPNTLSYASKALLLGVAGLVFTAAPLHAQPTLSGTYNCVRV